jgi:uncharacterized protein YeaO (DUF488 family)
MTINIKRAYEVAEKTDGYRILVDRLWPRSIPKEKAKIDLWLKDIAPSDGLRKWFGHDPERWPEFKTKYRAELESRGELLQEIKQLESENRAITLVYAAKDEAHNDAVVLKDVLGEKG